ncbi:hypothetical protein T492DRAFT_1071711 [Pavlovales sp. CCMP2436]|nr:hypothetical protein T492DRAFT_1071711 [Pavlovales sp. CCMP2436]|mmetsp:Transcript_35095/g.81178  ORF Transcript_35095/g.81178 Transcript_35095/m.81178 type:complete len:480 (-) Transcript_35095:137-1576(-)
MTSVAQTSASGGRKRLKAADAGGGAKPAFECKLRLDLQSLYEDGLLTDVQLTVCLGAGHPSKTFLCHRAILAASSSYFKACFTSCKEVGMGEVTLNDVDPSLFEDIVRLCYGGPITLSRANVVGLMHAATFYGIGDLRADCASFFQQPLEVAAYYELLDMSYSIRCPSAQQLCIRALAKDFSAAISDPAFPYISVESLKGMLEDPALSVPSEEEVLRALIIWVEHNLSSTQQAQAQGSERQPAAVDVDELLQLVRWPWLSTAVLCGVQERHQCLASSPTLERMLLQAFRFHALPAEQRTALVQSGGCAAPRPGLVHLGELLPDGLITDMTFVWNVHNFSSLSVESLFSPPVTVNGNRWNILMWPRRRSAQNGKETEWVSLYLNSVDVKNGYVEQLPSCAFELTVKSYKTPSASITREYEHAFDANEVDWGLSRFVQYSSVMDPAAGFLNGGTLTIIVAIHQILDEDEDPPQANLVERVD